jgi:chemotaxis protein methyltransferase WspC
MFEIEQLLRDTMGLDVATVGSDTLQQAVQSRMKTSGLRQFDDYLPRVRESAEELQALIEAVVVPETWFFRHVEAFEALTQWARSEWAARNCSGLLRILSVPCSTGEEPYSIAMALMDAGLRPEQFRVDAIDISRPALAQASRGLYRENSFRSADLSFRSRYFSEEAGAHRLAASIRNLVRFRMGNLYEPNFAGGEAYDVIFCRNVLIYFDNAKQKQAIAILTRRLVPTGVLFVGPAEGCLMLDGGFAPIGQRMSFGFQARGARAGVPVVSRVEPAKPKQRAVVRPPQQVVTKRPAVCAAVPPRPNAPSIDLAKARELADAGRLAEAESICENVLRDSAGSGDAYALLGIVQDAMGRSHEAEESYRRAIYLDPNQHQALAHLALIAERKHDVATARRLRDRARRAEGVSQ